MAISEQIEEVGYTEITYRLKRRQTGPDIEYAWILDGTGELLSPIFKSLTEARDWADRRNGKLHVRLET